MSKWIRQCKGNLLPNRELLFMRIPRYFLWNLTLIKQNLNKSFTIANYFIFYAWKISKHVIRASSTCINLMSRGREMLDIQFLSSLHKKMNKMALRRVENLFLISSSSWQREGLPVMSLFCFFVCNASVFARKTL